MNAHDFQDFTQRLTATLTDDSRVVGLVACGSMAALGRRDAFSDHDFFVIVDSGTQSEFRQNLAWLPDVERVVCAYLETEHGMKAIYDDGHILEFAVFDREELRLAKVNDYAVLVDKGGIAQLLEEIFVASSQTGEPRPDSYYYGQFFAI